MSQKRRNQGHGYFILHLLKRRISIIVFRIIKALEVNKGFLFIDCID